MKKIATEVERTDHGKFVKRRREVVGRAADEDAPMGAEQDSADSPRTELGEDDATVPLEASLVEGMFERDVTENEEEVERVILAMNEEAAAKDAVNNSERPVPEARSTLEQ